MGEKTSVDTTALLTAGRSLATSARLVHDARGAASRATSGAGWALDGGLPTALARYGETLGTALRRLGDDAREASALLALAASRYEAAETSATAPGASRDASARPLG